MTGYAKQSRAKEKRLPATPFVASLLANDGKIRLDLN
jgi:hypothetical protein